MSSHHFGRSALFALVAVLGRTALACGTEAVAVTEPAATESSEPTQGATGPTGSGFVSDAAASEPPCTIGATRSCTPPSAPADAAAGASMCSPGTQTCIRDAEFGKWGACEGAVYQQPAPAYTLQQTGGGENGTKVCCKPGDKLLTVVDCGDGKNHSAIQQGECGIGLEGKDNYGIACARITCKGNSLVCPDAGP